MYTLWWRDAGTQRMRVSFARNADVLLRRVAKLWHPLIDAALWAPDGERVPLRQPEPKKAKKPRAKAAEAPEGAPEEAAVT